MEEIARWNTESVISTIQELANMDEKQELLEIYKLHAELIDRDVTHHSL